MEGLALSSPPRTIHPSLMYSPIIGHKEIIVDMTDKIIVFVTCESREQAENIAQSVVTDKLAACVNVLPGIRSCYIWEGKLTWSDEVLLLIKTTRGRFDQLQDRVKELHSYSLPEIVGVTIDAAFDKYIAWIDSSVGA
jgi:periplasmic divalent cation tolerance protein